MKWLAGKKEERPGWIKAPSTVEMEIRTVWQDDDMPDEIKNAPGYSPFILGPDAQAWVDSMEEVVDGGNAVYGRPRPVVSPVRRSLSSIPAPPPPAPSRATPPPRTDAIPMPRIDTPPAWIDPPLPPTDAPAPIRMPEIAGAPAPPRTLPRRVLMPEIGEEEAAAQHASATSMPEIGDQQAAAPHGSPPLIPEIGDPKAAASGDSVPTMPEIAGQEAAASGGSAPAMPEIAEDEPPRRPPRMPEIGQ